MSDVIAFALLSLPLALITAALLLPTASELLSLIRVPWMSQPLRLAAGPSPMFVFLVLAHDEELLLGACVTSLLQQDYPATHRRVVVVADNCTDATAEVARAAGANTVLARHDTDRKGKPYAIAWALEQLDLRTTDGVVIIDADTTVAREYARMLADHAPLRGKVLQPFIAVQNPNENALTRMAWVHGIAAHGLAYRVKERAQLNVPLGVGMCIGTDVLRAEPWSAFSIAEDVELYAIFTARGVRIEPVPEAKITAQEAQTLNQSAPQRHRWMAGKLVVFGGYAGRVLRSRNIGFAQRLDALAELLTFGPVVHLGTASLGAVLALVAAPGGAAIATLLLLSLVRPVTYTLLAIRRDPAPGDAIRAFLYLPIYTVWRLGPALRSIIRGRERRWVRTMRNSTSPETSV